MRIKGLGTYIPQRTISNMEQCERLDVSPSFITEKVGILSVARKEPSQRASDLCCEAYRDLCRKCPEVEGAAIDFVLVCTQNPDYQLPQTSAVVQHKLGLGQQLAAFDISLGCSGYPYALSVAKSFMRENGLSHGLVFTADPYSDILDENDKNTVLLFGDAATATWLAHDGDYEIGKCVFKTLGGEHSALIREGSKPLFMDGRRIFNFMMRNVPGAIDACIEKNGLTRDGVDLFVFHQASKFLVNTLVSTMKLDRERVPFDIGEYGNTVSSSIPLVFSKYMGRDGDAKILMAGFGVGLSIASTILERVS